MYSDRCITRDNVHPTHSDRQGFCTPDDIPGLSVVVHDAYMARPQMRPKRPQFRRTFIRQWRQYRGLTLEQLAERLQTTHATLSRLERGMSPYSQELLEGIAEALRTDVASLLMRDPTDPDAIWSVWDQAQPGQRRVIVELAKTVIKTGT